MTVFGDKAFKEVITVKGGYMDGPQSNMTFKKRRLGHTHTEGKPCEDPGRRWPSASQRERPQKKPILPTS